jgi:hypothetical protein
VERQTRIGGDERGGEVLRQECFLVLDISEKANSFLRNRKKIEPESDMAYYE